MPNSTVPAIAWNKAETAEMQEVIGLYGKTYHFWQVDRDDTLPLGQPELMMSFTKDEQVPWELVKERDARFGVDVMQKRKLREGVSRDSPVHQDADGCWKWTSFLGHGIEYYSLINDRWSPNRLAGYPLPRSSAKPRHKWMQHQLTSFH